MRSAGFTLVEVSLAVVIMALALIPVASMIISSTRQTRFNEDQALAALLAAQILERYRDEPLDWLAANLREPAPDRIAGDPALSPRGDVLGQEYMRYVDTFERHVTYVPKDGATGVLVAEVRWRERGGAARAVVEKLIVGRSHARGARP